MMRGSMRMIATDSIHSRAEGYRILHKRVDGNDVEAVFDAVKRAREEILENNKFKTVQILNRRKSIVQSTRQREKNIWNTFPIVSWLNRLRDMI